MVHVSNFRPVKRVDRALEVFRLIRQRVRARFALVGDGPVRAEIEQLVNEAGLQDDVIFLGERQDLVGLLSSADLFLLPSAQESFGLAALEAMACEVPVVASNVGGLPEIIEDGVTGFVCPPDAIDQHGGKGRGAADGRCAARIDYERCRTARPVRGTAQRWSSLSTKRRTRRCSERPSSAGVSLPDLPPLYSQPCLCLPPTLVPCSAR